MQDQIYCCVYSGILTHIHAHKYGYACTWTTTILIIASHTWVGLHYWLSKYCAGHLRAWSSEVWTVTTSILEKYGKKILSITALYTIKGVSSCDNVQNQWSWVPIQTKSIVKVQTTIEKLLLCHRSKALVDRQGKTLEGQDIELSPQTMTTSE